MTLRPGSITARLKLGLGAITLLVFSVSGVILHRALASDLAAADFESLRSKSGVVQHFIEEARRSGNFTALTHHLDDLRVGHNGLQVWLQSASGDAIYGGAMPAPQAHPQALSMVQVASSGGVRLELLDARLPELSPWPRGLVRVGIDTQPRQRLLAAHRNTLLAVGVLGVVLTVGLSGVSIRRGLSSVKRLSAEASAITPETLGKRLSVAAEENELQGLVQAFNAVLDRLETAYSQMEAFSANVAHELRTPLATLINGAQVVLASGRSAADLKEAFASTLEELEQMNALVRDMLFLARADSGDRVRGAALVDLGIEADRTIRYCDALLQEAGVGARYMGGAVVLCDRALIRRALVNLLLNAIRYTPRGSDVLVEIQQSLDRVRLTVFNPGTEIPANVRIRMFDRFFRAATADRRTGDGQGLGLTIVAAIARMHGGRVFAEYTGSGNRIGLEFPAPPGGDAA